MNIVIKGEESTPFVNEIDIYPDGTTPMYRDTDGKLWAIAGHLGKGHIGMFCGSTLSDMKEVYPIQLNFCGGHADYAFSGIRYPEGVKARGGVWPFGLYICPNTHRFFCYFHNESGWAGRGTAYDSFGICEKPLIDSDFRHVGLMHSDDEGKTWTFDRWVLTAEEVCFTEYYNPGAGPVIGQKRGNVSLGSGDFSLYVEPEGEYIYIYYGIIKIDTEKKCWTRCDAYVARTRKRTDGVLGDFVKYYNGSFCEAGNLGKESVIVDSAWHPRVVYSNKFNKYYMTSCVPRFNVPKGFVSDIMEVRSSDDMIHWSEPSRVMYKGKEFGNHYVCMAYDGADCQPNIIPCDEFLILTNHNGTDVKKYPAVF